ncbi:hypothetical protein ROR02_31780 [Pararhodospirillum oryzae]|uniref:Uncharacterized protein n=1 Tax=Pararhodospirillum oryzae TaxID=478448 RepID=A0A512HC62_9PROT|nr:hypothetical protein ROR02_31780 [Pararhodospirillum oryzae]
MLEQPVPDLAPKRIQDDANPLTPSQFGCGYKIAVAGNQNNGIDLPLERKRSDINADSHVHGFLPESGLKISICQFGYLTLSINNFFLGTFF